MSGRIAQLGEHLGHNQDVTGSNPVSPTKINAEIAQLVEYNLAKVGVAGSNPVFRSIGGIAKW